MQYWFGVSQRLKNLSQLATVHCCKKSLKHSREISPPQEWPLDKNRACVIFTDAKYTVHNTIGWDRSHILSNATDEGGRQEHRMRQQMTKDSPAQDHKNWQPSLSLAGSCSDQTLVEVAPLSRWPPRWEERCTGCGGYQRRSGAAAFCAPTPARQERRAHSQHR